MLFKRKKEKPVVSATARAKRKPVDGMEQGGAWRAEVSARIAELEDRLAAVTADPTSAEQQAIRGSVDAELDRASTAAGRSLPPSLPAWWSGSSTTKAWESVHNAEFALLQIESDDAVLVTVPRLLSWVQRVMDTGSDLEGHETALKAEIEKQGEKPAPNRVRIRAALADVISANGRRYAAVRTFRNNLILAIGVLAILLLTVAVWHANNVNFLSLCGSESATGKLQECLGAKKSGPFAGEIWLVLLMGALGGSLGIAFKLSQSEDPTRFNPKSWQRLLKPVTGAATGFAAVLFLQSHQFVQLPTENQTRITYMAYALIFGFSQQLLTKFVDERAENLVKPETK